MITTFLKVFEILARLSLWLLIPIGIAVAVFTLLCAVWYLIIKKKYRKIMPVSGTVPQKRSGILKQLLVDIPRRFMLDKFDRDPDHFGINGIHMFCGEQGCGKTIACVEMMLRLQKQYPKSKCISNFALTSEDDQLDDWHMLLDYTNGKKGVIVGIDEIQNWFMSGQNKLPEEMLEVATQNRKNCRVLCCTAQVFTRVNKGLREQVKLVYNPHTFLGCFTVVIIRKPEFDSEGNVIKMKYRGMYSFTHTDELRDSYDTYKVIHTLSREGFKDKLPGYTHNTNVYIREDPKKLFKKRSI